MKKIDPAVSKHMSELAKRRKQPYYAFSDPAVQKRAQAARKKNAVNRKAVPQLRQAEEDNQDQGS